MSAAENQQIDFEGYLITHFTQLPNMAFEQLEPYAYKLLAVYLDTIRQAEKGVCFKSNETIAKQVGCSVNRMKKARQELVKLGYIVVALGTESTSRVTIQLSKMWTKNHAIESKKQEERRQQKQSEGGYQDLTPPYQTVTGGVSQFDTKEKESNKTQLKKEKETPISPQAETITNGKPSVLSEMQEAVKTHLKQYGRQNEQVAKSLLGLHVGKNEGLNLSRKFTPALLAEFGAWWDKNFRKDGSPLTRPKNLDSVKSYGEQFLDSIASNSQTSKVIQAAPVTRRGVMDGVVTFNKPEKKEQAS